MRSAALIVLGCLISARAFAGEWSSLWRTPDQRGQALLEAGHPARAADRFADPRLKAYADLEAARYAQAAKLLAPFKDATSEYNRGNALARSGHLRAALAAYDAALKQTPGDKDILHNRDLVAHMLRRHPPKSPPHSGSQGNRQGAGKSGTGNRTGQAGKNPATGTQSGQDSGRASAGQQGRGASGAARGQGAGSGASSRTGSGTSASGTGSRRAGAHNGAGAAQPPGQEGTSAMPRPIAGSGPSKQGPGQARRDAALAAAIARGQAHPASKASGASTPAAASRGGAAKPHGARLGSTLLGGGTNTPKSKPVSEKTLALDQWLRQIPDDPAGLLRRKFLIEYMMKHPGQNP